VRINSKKIFHLVGTLSFLFLSSFELQSAKAQEVSIAEIYGKWIKSGTGDTIEFKSNADMILFLSGQASTFSGNGAFGKCTDGGGNLCITGLRLKCAYRYSIVQGQLNMQFRSGSPDLPCKAVSGDFRKAG